MSGVDQLRQQERTSHSQTPRVPGASEGRASCSVFRLQELMQKDLLNAYTMQLNVPRRAQGTRTSGGLRKTEGCLPGAALAR